MKPRKRTQNEFGLSQHEMAAVLGITPSLWSMYESGQRRLPAQALMLLTQLRQHLESSHPKSDKKVRDDDHQTTMWLKSKLEENAYQQLLLARKQETIANKLLAASRREQVVGFLKSGTDRLVKSAKAIPASKKQSASKKFSNESRQIELEYNQALLDFEKKWLLHELEKVPKTSANNQFLK